MLVFEGLISPLAKGKVQKYAAENPEKIINWAQNKIKKAQDILIESEKIAQAQKQIFELAWQGADEK